MTDVRDNPGKNRYERLGVADYRPMAEFIEEHPEYADLRA